MPTIEENLGYWTAYDWSNAGEEWTVGYGGADEAWEWAIRPRIGAFLPAAHVLELAPGYGLWTRYLRPLAKRMTLVDLTPRCIEHCRKTFGGRRMSYHVNDGRSLDMIEDGSIDFVFSWHSLVHANRDVMRAYVEQLGRKLSPGGGGVVHHSNLGAYADEVAGGLDPALQHWRGVDMTAEGLAEDCERAGLACVVQELVPWGSQRLIDCYSTFVRPRGGEAPPLVRFENRSYWDEVAARRAVHEAAGTP